MFSVVTPRIWVSPRSNSAEPCTRGEHLDLGGQRADVGEAATVDADLVAQDALADQRSCSALRYAALISFSRPSNWPRPAMSLNLVLDAVESRSRAPVLPAMVSGVLASSSAEKRPFRRPRTRRPGSRGRPGSPGDGLGGGLRRVRFCARHSSAMKGLLASRPDGDDLFGRAWCRHPRRGSIERLGGLGLDHHDRDVAVLEQRPATTMSNVARSSSVWVGKPTHWPSIRRDAGAADRAAERQAGQLGDAEAALIASTS